MTLRQFRYQPPLVQPELIHDDKDFVIVNKPAGLLSVPGKAEHHRDCLENRLQHVYPEITTIHRLDMSTSGLMVFARTANAHRHIGLQFEKRQVTKTYIALVAGCPKSDSGIIDLPLICDWPNRPKQMVDLEKGKQAQTEWKVLKRHQGFSRVLLSPKTGRSHQLRVHMQTMGHAILGDRLYADDATYKAASRLMLHAHTLSFRHPDGGEPVHFESPCPF